MSIPLLAHPKHTYSNISGLTDSESEYSYDSEDELDNLIQYSKEAEANSTTNFKTDQDSLPPYEILDAILDHYVVQGRSLGEIIKLGFEEATVRRVIRLIDVNQDAITFPDGPPIEVEISK